METMEYLFGESAYLGLTLFLLTIFLMVWGAEATRTWIWERFGERISQAFRQLRS